MLSEEWKKDVWGILRENSEYGEDRAIFWDLVGTLENK